MLVIDGSSIRRIGLRWRPDQACQSTMDLRSGMDASAIGSPKIIIFSVKKKLAFEIARFMLPRKYFTDFLP